MRFTHLLFSLATLLLTTKASTFSPARPPSIPLAVRSPYLSTWLPAGNNGDQSGLLAGRWPQFWATHTTAWSGMIRVDGTSYTWMGQPGPASVNQVSFNYTSTKSIFTSTVNDAVQLTITFLSPVSPNDLKRQSLVFSYLNVDVHSTDGKSHDVQLYTDITGEWASGDAGAVVEWDYSTVGSVAYHQIHRQTQLAFSEIQDNAEWGKWYYGTDATDRLTYQSGSDKDVRGAFTSKGNLANTKDTNYRAINNNWPTFGFAVNLGTVDATPQTTLFSIGLAQSECAQYSYSTGNASVASLWKSYFANDTAALEFFHTDYKTAFSSSTDLDNKIASDSIAAAGQDYATITSLATRQAFGATQLVGSTDKPWLFMKEISSNGNFQTVDVFFPMHPILLYTNPELLKMIMDPHFDYQESGQYPNKWAIHDLGAHYPNATGHADGKDEPMPLEESGNMINMVLAYAERANNTQYLEQHYQILNQWAQYLILDTEYPGEQLSTDDFAGRLSNQTNLGIKGIIGLNAMSRIANLSGHADDGKKYADTASRYYQTWSKLGIAENANPPHTTLNYSNDASWGILYNLYCDRELGLNLVPQAIYDQQSKYYPTVARKYGVPLDTRNTYTKSDWEMFAAAIASTETRDLFISDLAKWIRETPTDRPMTDLFYTDNGAFPTGITFNARPVVGGMFALLALPK